jgi:putative membrane protein
MWKTLWGLIFIGVMLWSAIGAKDTVIWWLEALPSLVGALVLVVTYQVFRLTPMLYALILAHMVVLFVGAHYTYAEVPLFDWVAQALGQERNNFDKLGHFMQGLVPALIAREILLRKAIVNGQVWLNFLVVCFALALSAFYELIEWWVALLSEQAAEAFLGTQGYVWDTQSDMGFALLGAFVAVSLLSGWQDKQIRALR